jgi:hypothetical protein
MASAKAIDITVAVSDLAPLCQMDHYNNFARIVCKLWSKLHPESYTKYKTDCYKKGDYVANDSMKQKMLVLNNKLTGNKVNVVKEVAQINKLKNNTAELQEKQSDLYKKLQSVIDEKAKSASSTEEREELKKQAQELHSIVKSATNVVYGTKNEHIGYKFFEEVTGIAIMQRQTYMKHRIATFELPTGKKIRWYISGLSDGETVLDEIIEIKNRQKKLFNTVRDYEMCQIQTYMHISDKLQGYLVEIITDSENNLSGNVIKVDRKDDYFASVVLDNLTHVINFLMSLFYFDDANRMFSEEERESILINLIKGDPDKFVKTLVYN